MTRYATGGFIPERAGADAPVLLSPGVFELSPRQADAVDRVLADTGTSLAELLDRPQAPHFEGE